MKKKIQKSKSFIQIADELEEEPDNYSITLRMRFAEYQSSN